MATSIAYRYRAHRYRWRHDRAELKFLCQRLLPGQVAVDAGCHKGAYTYWMRQRVGPAGEVVAFEPQPRQARYLRSVFSAMRYANVTLVPMALSQAAGRRPLHISPHSSHAATLVTAPPIPSHAANGATLAAPAANSSFLLVDVTTLDRYFAGRPRGPDFIKIDVEGHELAVLEGGRQTLALHRPTLLVECEVRHRADGDVRPVFDFLQSLGYRGSFFSNNGRRPLAEFDPQVHQCVDGRTGRLPRDYVNNFAFEWPASA